MFRFRHDAELTCSGPANSGASRCFLPAADAKPLNPRERSMRKDTVELIYQVKVTLTGVKPVVWRRLLVPSAMSLKKFHQILQIPLGWTDSHLHEFEAHGQTYGIPHSEYPNTTKNEARVALNKVLVKETDALTYEYDFGDGWQHKVVLEKILT